MLGKNKIKDFKYLVACFVLLTSCITGCQNPYSSSGEANINSGEANIKVTDDINEYLEVKMSAKQFVNEFHQEPIDNLIQQGKCFNYPKDVYFIPTHINNDAIIFGEADFSDDRSELYLASYNLNNEEFKKIKKVDESSKFSSIGVIHTSDNIVLFEENNHENQNSKLYLYDIKKNKYSLIKESKNMSPIHYTQVCEMGNDLILNILNTNENIYQNYIYSLDDFSLKLLEKENCGFPIVVNNQLYYIIIDNNNLNTKLVNFDLTNMKKTVLYSTNSRTEYISGLYSDKNKVYMTIKDENDENWFYVDLHNKFIDYSFSTSVIESVQFKNHYVSWAGSSTQENRVRLEYSLIDINSKTNYINPNGMLLLSDNGFVCIKYKKNDLEIPKGEMYKYENTSICYYEWQS